MRRFFSLIFNRTTLVLIGLIALALLVWFIGPLVSVGRWVPFESVLVRAVLIALIFATWGVIRLVSWWRARRANAQLLNQIAKESDKVADPRALGSEEVGELRKRFDAAMATLRNTRIDSGRKGLFARFSRRYVYQMPWYMIIGAPGSGKTTALVNSGIEFPLAKEFGKAAIRGVGGTRNCDWWFTNDAVLLDTAGRYTTQESNEALDKAEWRGFLALLRKFRPRAPINGVLLTISVADLLAGDEVEREKHAAAIRRRLSELDETLKRRLPLYVLVTKVDLLAGFAEYFARLSNEDRAQVWGFTLPLGVSEAADADIAAEFRNEFGQLQKRVELALPDVLQVEPDQAKRALAYAFTQELAGLREVLDRFLQAVFASSKYSAPPMVRGVYLTSGTQEGTPFDRVLGAISRRFGIATAIAPATGMQGSSGRSYFLRTLLQKVVFVESFLVERNAARDRRRRWYQAVGIAACVVLLAATLTAWFVSYGNNRAYIAEVAPRVESLAKAVKDAAPATNDEWISVLPLLDDARGLASSNSFDVESPPLAYRFGLYQGRNVKAAADGVYDRLLDDLLLPRVAQRVTRLLREAPPDNLEAMYGRLKAYLMLYEAEHYQPAYLLAAVRADLQSREAAALPREAQQSMSQHLGRLFETRVRQSPYPIDEALVADMRTKLGRLSQAQRLYGQLKMLAGSRVQSQAPDFTLLGAVGPDATLVFARASGRSLDLGVPALFTREGYRTMSNVLQDRRFLLQLDETWVLGKADRAASSRLTDLVDERLVGEIRRYYLEDYRREWDTFLFDLKLAPTPNLAASIQLLRILSAPDSPLTKLIKAVAAETTLVETGKSGIAVTERAVEVVKEAANREAQRVFGSAAARRDGPSDANRAGRIEQQLVDDYFEPWRRLAGSPQQGGDGEALKNLLAEQYNVLVATESALRSRNTPPQTDTSAKLLAQAARLPRPLRGWFENVAATSSGQTAGVTRSSVGAQLDASVGDFCRKAIAGRYPFVRSATRDVPPDDFGRLFGPGGMMDEFFQRSLKEVVDTSTPQWTYRRGIDGAPAGTSGSIVAFQKAAVIRDVFFASGARSPQFRIDIKPIEMDASITSLSLDVDGTTVAYAHGPPTPRSVVWPGPGGRSQIRLQLSPTTTGSSGATFEGPWALHRLFDKAQVTPGASPERFTAAFNIDGRRVVFEVTAASVRNPFRLRELDDFACPGRL